MPEITTRIGAVTMYWFAVKLPVLILLVIAICQSTFGQNEFRVIKQVGPTYPAAARAVRAIGDVGVEVRFDKAGKVVEAKANRGHPILRAACESAAKQWLFSASDDEPDRTRLLSFFFKVGGEVRYINESEKYEEAVTTHNFLDSFSAEVTYETLVPRLLLLPREKGAIKPKACTLHKSEMSVENRVCDIVDFEPFARSEKYNDAEDELFPEANIQERSGCGYHGIERAEIHYCSDCRVARLTWLAGRL